MSLRFASQLCIDNLPDEQLNDQFEVIMPELNIAPLQRTGKALYGSTPGFFGNSIYNYQPIVEEITFGHKNFVLDTRRVRTGWIGVPKDIEKIHDVKITMFCPASMATHYYLNAWRRLIFNEEGEFYYPVSNYKKNIDIFIKGPISNSLLKMVGVDTDCHITLQGCFPYMEKDFEFEYTDNPKRFRILATFNVDNVKYDFKSAKQALSTELISSPTSMIDKAITSLGGGGTNSTYDINETYGGRGNTKSSITNGFL